MTMRKSGVGKTTRATAIAVALAERAYIVHLTTTDPLPTAYDDVVGGSNRPCRGDGAIYSEEMIAAVGALTKRVAPCSRLHERHTLTSDNRLGTLLSNA